MTEVVRLGAWCDLETEQEARARLTAGGPEPVDPDAPIGPGRWVPGPDERVLQPGSLSFRVEEFAVLDDGRRLRLHDERGFAVSGPPDPWQHVDDEDLRSTVLATVLPDDAEQTGDEHPWEWLAQLLRTAGVVVAPEQLRALPYEVELSERVRERLRR